MKTTDFSKERQQYLTAQKRSGYLIRFSQIAIVVLFLLLWEILTDLKIIDSFFFSSPSRLAECCFTLFLNNHLLSHIGITLAETCISFGFVIVLTLLFSILLWYWQTVSKIAEPFFVVLNSLPKSALAPLLIVWLGANMKTIILTGLSVAVFGSILSLFRGFREIEPDKIKLIYTLGGNRMDVLTKVILPANIPNLLTIMKVNIGLCLVGVIIGEFIAARMGLGYLIIYGSQVYKMDWVILSILILCVIAFSLYQLLHCLENKYLSKN